MTHPKVLTALAGIGIGLAVLFSFVALILAGATLRKLNNDGAGATSNGAATTTTAKLVVAASSKAWTYGEGPASCGSCLTSTLFAGKTYPAGTSKICNNETHLFITVDVNDNFCWNEIQIDLRSDCVADSSSVPGQFNYKIAAPANTCSSATVTLTVPLNGAPVGTYYCVPIHLAGQLSNSGAGNGGQTAWAGCKDFAGANWAMVRDHYVAFRDK